MNTAVLNSVIPSKVTKEKAITTLKEILWIAEIFTVTAVATIAMSLTWVN